MANELSGRRVAFLATDGVEEVEYTEPREAVEKAGAQADLVSLNTGRIQAMISPLASVFGITQADALRILAVTSASRTPLAPDYPTLAEAQLPGITSLAWNGLFAPSTMPTDLVDRLAAEAGRDRLVGPRAGDRARAAARARVG